MKIYLCVFIAFALTLHVFANKSKLLEDFVVANRKFTADVYHEVTKRSSGNLLICPLSAEIILGLARFGAKGNTAKELALHINNEEDARNLFVRLNSNLKAINDKYILSSANNIFLNKEYVINKEFKSIAYSDFNAGVQNVDFSRTQEVLDYINSWVEQKTHYKIKNLLSNGQVSGDTAAVLVNALYFHGDWINQFDPHGTFKQKFHVNNQTSIEIDVMSTNTEFKYYESNELSAKFLEMPFEGDDVSMTIVLPNEKFGLKQLEDRIYDVLLSPNYQNEEVDIIIPKFKIESDINFKPVLQSMGVRDAFTSKADFSGIVKSGPPLQIDQVIQKTFLEINEKGATAAASTAVGIVFNSFSPYTFIADHPFLFYLKHKTIGIMFIGKFIEPTI